VILVELDPGDSHLERLLYVDPATANLTWDAALSKPGCLNVKALDQILLADN
jgi:hypothetical protein